MNYDLPLFDAAKKPATVFLPISDERLNKTSECLIQLLNPIDESERISFSKATQNLLKLYKDVIDAHNLAPVYVASMFILAAPGLDLSAGSHREIITQIFAASRNIDISAIQERIKTLENQLLQFKDIGVQMNLIKETERKAAEVLKKQKDKLYYSKKKLLKEKEEAVTKIKSIEAIMDQISSDLSLTERKKILLSEKIKLEEESDNLKDKIETRKKEIRKHKKVKTVIDDVKRKLSILDEKRINLKNEIQGLSGKEEFAKKQMESVSDELAETNNQGSEYVEKLEALETQIINIEESISQLELSSIPKHVVEEILSFPQKLERFKNVMQTLEYMSEQIFELEKHIGKLQYEQNRLHTYGDRSAELEELREEMNNTRMELERLKGKAESYEEGKKQLADNRCPILEITCTSIDEPVEDFFDKKLAVVRVEIKTLEKKERILLERLNQFDKEQKNFREWQDIQSRISQTNALLQEAVENYYQREEELSALKFGEDAIQCHTLLENIFSGKELRPFLNAVMKIGVLPDSDNISKRVSLFKKNLEKISEQWENIYQKFTTLVREKESKLDLLREKMNSLQNKKNQLKEEYGIICRQAETLENRRKELSEVLFSVEKIKILKNQLEKIENGIKKYSRILENLNKMEEEIQEKKTDLTYLRKSLKQSEQKISEMEAALTEIEGLLNKSRDNNKEYDKEELTKEISILRKKVETIDDKILLLIEQRELIDRQNAVYLVSPDSAENEAENKKLTMLNSEKEKLQRKLYQIEGQFTGFLEGFSKTNGGAETDNLLQDVENPLYLTRYLLANLFWKKNKKMAVALEENQLAFWCNLRMDEKPDYILAPEKYSGKFKNLCG